MSREDSAEVGGINRLSGISLTRRIFSSNRLTTAIVTALATLSLTSMPVGAVSNLPRIREVATNRDATHAKRPARAEPSCGTFFDNVGALVAAGSASVLGPNVGVKLSTSKFMPGYPPGGVKQTCYYEFTGTETLWDGNGNTAPPPSSNIYVFWGDVTAREWNIMKTNTSGISGCVGGSCATTVSPLSFGPGTQGVLVTTATNGAWILPSNSPYADYYGEMVRKRNCVLEISFWPVASPSTITALINQFLVRHPTF
jgi:hypothetical protein